jgi:hypothetical protein
MRECSRCGPAAALRHPRERIQSPFSSAAAAIHDANAGAVLRGAGDSAVATQRGCKVGTAKCEAASVLPRALLRQHGRRRELHARLRRTQRRYELAMAALPAQQRP